jgi:membrane protease YdiL (CAAX protease family)
MPGTENSTRAIVAFLVVTFVWAWGFWGYWVPAMGAGGLELSPAFLACALIGGLGPSVAAIAVSLWLLGPGGLRDLLRQALRWNVGARWYAIALFLVPAVTIISLAGQYLFGGPLTWPPPSIIPVAIFWPILASLGEEFGWRGFLLPRLQARWGALAAAFVIGIIWGVWHLPADYVGLKGLGWWFPPAFVVNGPFVLTAHSVIMTWLYNRSGRNFTLMLVYHFSVTATAILSPSLTANDGLKVLSPFITGCLLWIVALALIAFRRADFPAATRRVP